MQIMNPYLPLHEHIPDGEPHVFGDRVYVIGSHDREQGNIFCEHSYQFYSAPLSDLGAWTSRGLCFSGWQDPAATFERHYLYAPDVVQGNDGRFYLYYCLSEASGHCYDGPIGVAVCDTPDGVYRFHGHVKYADGRIMEDYIAFDPAVLNDNGAIHLYYGCGLLGMPGEMTPEYASEFFSKPLEATKKDPYQFFGPAHCELEDDMLTVKAAPQLIFPAVAKGTEFEGHGFFEASSIRKVNGRYYFVYSTEFCHSLCYAVSDRPDGPFRYGGVVVDNCDMELNGNTVPKAVPGNNHGGMVELNGQWYIFYHRHTNKTQYSRQGCAEPITILPDGSIPQVEITSCGLNGKPLKGSGIYNATYCCNLISPEMPVEPLDVFSPSQRLSYITTDGTDAYITDLYEPCMAGYKYFDLQGNTHITVTCRGAAGSLEVMAEENGEVLGTIPLSAGEGWHRCSADVPLPHGKSALYLRYRGTGAIDLMDLELIPISE